MRIAARSEDWCSRAHNESYNYCYIYQSVIFKQGGWSGLGAGGERIYSIVLSCRIIDGEYGSKGASCAREYGGLGANGAWVMERRQS